jgi:hypothetical protein
LLLALLLKVTGAQAVHIRDRHAQGLHQSGIEQVLTEGVPERQVVSCDRLLSKVGGFALLLEAVEELVVEDKELLLVLRVNQDLREVLQLERPACGRQNVALEIRIL